MSQKGQNQTPAPQQNKHLHRKVERGLDFLGYHFSPSGFTARP